MSGVYTASSAAKLLTDTYGEDISPRHVTNVIYDEPGLAKACPLWGGRRSIPEAALPLLVDALRRRGKLLTEAVA
ncbi:MAG: hypothetical protein U0836_17990 [Pirellulales bacterium]